MTELDLRDYTEGLAKYLDNRFSQNNLGIIPIKKDYSNGFRGRHKPFDLNFEGKFQRRRNPSRNYQCDFHIEFDFLSNSLADQLGIEIGVGNEVNDGKLSKIIDNVRRGYEYSKVSERGILRIDTDIATLPREENDLYNDIWSSILRRPFLALIK